MYEPRFIYFSKDLNVCGSVYQDINIFLFLKKNLDKICNGIVLTCPPCQVDAIKKLLSKNKIKHFIISFSCSGQMTIEGTWKYYGLLGINRKDVDSIQYRGNGWPSGIQIKLSTGDIIKKNNYTEPWRSIHQSKLYCPIRCLYCKYDTSYSSDISLADPWLKSFLNEDKIGTTLFLINSQIGKDVIDELVVNNIISLKNASISEYKIAQAPNCLKKTNVLVNKKAIDVLSKLRKSRAYKKIFTHSLFFLKLHILLLKIIYKLYRKR